MRTIAFLTQKGGAGKTTLAASLAVAAAHAGERVIALDLDPQASLLLWGKYREATNAPTKVVIEPLENERLPRLRAILDGLAGVGFTLAIFDTAGSDGPAARFVTEAADICLCRRAQRVWMWPRRQQLFEPSFWQSAKLRSSSTNARRPIAVRGRAKRQKA